MPQDPSLWVIIALLVAAVVVVALWKGFNVRLGKGDLTASFERSNVEGGAVSGTSVARSARIEEAEVGNITGRRVTGKNVEAGTGGLDVLERARLRKTRIGDITGEEINKR